MNFLLPGSRCGRFVAPLLVLAGLLAGASGCRSPERFVANYEKVVECDVQRDECALQTLNEDGTVGCVGFERKSFKASVCGFRDQSPTCRERFCVAPDGTPYPSCVVTAGFPKALPLGVTCASRNVPEGERLALVQYTQTSRSCVPDLDGNSCASLPEESRTESVCFNPSRSSAVDALSPPSDRRDGRINILSVLPNAAQCPVAAAGPLSQAFDVTPGVVASAIGAGFQVALQARRGFAVVNRLCDPLNEFCTSQLGQLQLNLSDATVAGVSLRNLEVTNTVPAAIGEARQPDGSFRPTLPARALQLMIVGLFNGVSSFIRAENRSPMLIDTSAGTFALSGTFAFQATDLRGRLMPISVAVDVRGPRSTPDHHACQDLSSRNRLFGFEDPLSWTSSVANLSLLTSPLMQGCGALGVEGRGYMPIVGGQFSTVGLAVDQAITVDLFVPDIQPNPYWLGALQMYLSCPSGNVFNQFIGQVELTGRPQNSFSALRFPIPDAVRDSLTQPLDDCAFSLALNVNATGRTWVLDNLRFTP